MLYISYIAIKLEKIVPLTVFQSYMAKCLFLQCVKSTYEHILLRYSFIILLVLFTVIPSF